MFTYLAEGSTLKNAARQTGICFETARKYFRKGDVKRGIKPLQERLIVFQEKVSEKMNVLLEEHRAQRLSVVRALIQKVELKLVGGKDAEGNEIIAEDLSKISIRDLERLYKLETFLCGGVTSKSKETKMLSAESIANTE